MTSSGCDELTALADPTGARARNLGTRSSPPTQRLDEPSLPGGRSLGA